MSAPNSTRPHQTEFDLEGVRMNVPVTAPGGVVNAETIFQFHQQGSLVSAKYTGGRIRLGYLVGILNGTHLEFRYAQADVDGNLDGGLSKCELQRAEDGRVRIVENFQWASREGSGTNVIEQLPD